MTVSVAIATHPSRAGLLTRTLETLRADRAVSVVEDDGRGAWPTLRRAWEVGITAGASHHVVLQDDVLCCRDLLPACDQIADLAPTRIVSLFKCGAIIMSAWERGERWLECPTLSWAQGTLMPVWAVSRVLRYSAAKVRPECPHDDARFSVYLLATRQRALITVPCLLEHAAPDSSLIGPSHRALAGNTRRAGLWLGEGWSALSVDWRLGLNTPHRIQGHRPREYASMLKDPARFLSELDR